MGIFSGFRTEGVLLKMTIIPVRPVSIVASLKISNISTPVVSSIKGDRREINEAEKVERAAEIKDVNTPGGKGSGII